MTTTKKHPDWKDPEVSILGVDGNAFSIISFVTRALMKAGNNNEVVEAYTHDAMADDYDHLLRVSMDYAGMLADD